MKSASEQLEEVQREKLAARPPEIDFRAALAVHSQKIMDIMDDKHLAVEGEISELRKEVAAVNAWRLHYESSIIARVKYIVRVRVHRWLGRIRVWWADEDEFDGDR